MEAKPLAGRVVLITGSSRGIGAAMAKRFAREGGRVAVHYGRSSQAADQVLRDIRAAGGEADAFQADTAKPEEIAQLFEQVHRHFGRLDVLVNNAAIMEREFLPDISAESIDRHLTVNVRGYLLCCQHAARLLPSGGVIINVSSAITRMAYPGSVVYTATKGAINMVTQVLAVELGSKGIRVNTLSPGSTITDMNGPASGKTDEEAQQEIANTPLGRQGVVEDIADAAVFLATNDARWVTGANLDVSGGIRE
jgi:3-oxoacyl-[acyl-carrier protein] reductase